MSESAGKTFRGLQEAYASIYTNKSENLTEDTIVSEVQEEQEFQIDEEKLLITMVDYLVVEGYVKTENEALKMIPHISEEWMDDIVSHIYLSEGFYSCVDSLIKEGYDLSSSNEEYLFELYVEGVNNYLNEQIAGDFDGSLTNTILGGIGAAGLWGLNNLQKALTNTKPVWRDYGQSGTSTYKPKPKPKPKPAPVVKTQIDTDKPQFGQPQPKDTNLGGTQQKSGSTYPQFMPRSGDVDLGGVEKSSGTSGGGGGGDNGDNEPPKDKKPGLVGKALDKLNNWATKVKEPKPPGQGMSPTQQKLLNIGKKIFIKSPGEGLRVGLAKRYGSLLGGGLGIDQILGGRQTSRVIELGKTLHHRANVGAEDDKKTIERRGDEDRHRISTEYEERKKRESAQAAELERIRNGSQPSAPQSVTLTPSKYKMPRLPQ